MVVLAGITSWGIGCAQADHPGEWAKISNYIDWIEPHLTSGKIQNQMTRLTTTTATTTTTTKKAKIEYSQSSRLRIRRYCSSDTPNAELSEYTDINVGMIGKAGKIRVSSSSKHTVNEYSKLFYISCSPYHSSTYSFKKLHNVISMLKRRFWLE